MRTDAPHRPPSGHGPDLDRFRALVSDPVRSLADWGRGLGPSGWVRLGAAALLLITLVGLGSRYTRATGEPSGYEWLFDGRTLTSHQTARITAALQAADVPSLESEGKIGVPSGRRARALEVLAKAKLGPRPLDDVLDEAAGPGSLWESPQDRDARERRQRERACAQAITWLPGILEATVKLSPIESGSRLQPSRRQRATVFVRSQTDGPLPAQTVQMIGYVLHSMEGVEREQVTLIDPTAGHEYLVAGRPEVERLSTAQAQSDELQERIRGQLPIDGARVVVRIDPPTVVATDASTAPAMTAASSRGGLKANRPLRSGSTAAATPAPATVTAPATPAEPRWSEGQATVLVLVPRSYYVRLFRDQHPNREPSASDLMPYVTRSDEMVRKIIRTMPGAASVAAVTIERIDDLSPARPAVATGPADRPGPWPTWAVPALGAGLAGALLMALIGRGLRSGRGAPARPEASRRREPFQAADVDADVTCPTERVRGLIRHDPAAAAGVLHRWIAQGGGTA